MNHIKITYDKEADVLYFIKEDCKFTEYKEISDNIILRLNPDNKKMIGFTLIDSSKHFSTTLEDSDLPFQIDFEIYKSIAKVYPISITN